MGPEITSPHLDLLRKIRAMGAHGGAPPRWLARETGMRIETVYLLANDCMTAGLVQRPNGDTFVLTPSGQALLDQP